MLQKLAKTSSTSMQNRLYSPQENGRDIMRFSFRMCDVIRSNVTRRNVIGCNNESIMLMTLQVCRSFASFCYIYILFYSSISSIFFIFFTCGRLNGPVQTLRCAICHKSLQPRSDLYASHNIQQSFAHIYNFSGAEIFLQPGGKF